MKGIDISKYDGTVNFTKVKNAGIKVVIMKATQGVGLTDSKFEDNSKAIIGTELNYGFYHFMSEKTDPEEQAVYFWNAIKSKKFNIPPVLDIETNTYKRTAKEITDRCLAFLKKFKALSGYDCMIYTGGYFGRDSLDKRIKSYKAWIAHYGVSKPMETGFTNVVGHQYSETGTVSGISTKCDLDNFTEKVFLTDPNVKSSTKYSKKVAELQKIAGVTADGYYGPITDASIKKLIAGIDYKDTELTKWVQGIVGVTVDGSFGPITAAAVKKWQTAHKLTVNGVAGYATVKSMALA